MTIPNPTAAVHPESATRAAGVATDAASGLEQHRRRTYALRPGLHLHADDAIDTQDYVAQGEIGKNLRMIVLLEGSVNLRYGERKLQLSSAASDRSRAVRASHWPQAVLLSLAQAERFERHARRGTYARRLSLCVGAQWLEPVMAGQPMRSVDDFVHSHLAMRHWQPTARFAALAEQIVRAPALNAPFLHLYMESRVLELVSEGLLQLGQADGAVPAQGARLLPHEHRRIRALHDFLQTEQAVDTSLDALARQAGANANTLQKHFRAVYGTTIFDFLREQRLQRARGALERDGLSVAQAAHLAGYTSAANFATAYRRRFGMPPKLARGRV
ncbi:MAG: helix-turn-helix transcriptional regulator [Burkholderiales bacterium]|nr:helix-turn-helix transcriptional regulator [Burkholderiales bacterium]